MTKVYLVAQGEIYYDAWIPQIIVPTYEQAAAFARQEILQSEVQRWPNTYIWQFTIGRPGGRLLSLTLED